jgi:hypothetical protein
MINPRYHHAMTNVKNRGVFAIGSLEKGHSDRVEVFGSESQW